jgi:uncharacterized membrane protein
MNEIADNFLLVRRVAVGAVCFFIGYTLVKRYIVRPAISTMKFLSNETKNLEKELH